MKIKQILSAFSAAALGASLLAGCGSAARTAHNEPAAVQKLSIVTTIFPEYDWVRQLLGSRADAVDLTLLMDSGTDLHSYQPTADDIAKIAGCDLFIYVGGGSDTWVDDALQEATNENMLTIDLCETLGDTVRQEEQIEGMENSHANEHAGDAEADGEDHHYTDEHVWLSLKNAQVLCTEISEALAKLDPDNADTYKANATVYREKLGSLDAEYRTAVDSAAQKTLLFGDRFPFRYLVDDYGLDYYAAFTGCSAESEASFETVTFLAQKVDELGLHTVLTIEKSNQEIARTIIENTQSKDQQILTMDSMQSTTAQDTADGATYLSAMQNNLAVLRQALQ